MNKPRDGRWFRDPDREAVRREKTEHFYGAGYVSHGLREHPLPKRYNERHYPRTYDPGHARR